MITRITRRTCRTGMAAVLTLLAWTAPADAQVKTIVIDQRVSPAFDGASFGTAGQYETLAGRAFGELDPNDPRNAIITDIRLAPTNARGMVEYIATFFVVKPIAMSRSSHLMWHDVPNRGGRVTIPAAEREFGDVGLSSGWQGDNSGGTAHHAAGREYVVVPVARNLNGSAITGLVPGRIMNATGVTSQPLIIHSNPMPYRPVSLDTTTATLTTATFEGIDGEVRGTKAVPAGDWAWARCSAERPFPGTPDPTQICMKNGFDPSLIYRVTFTAQDPPVLGIGFAAFRDVASFFKNARQDVDGTPNPLAGQVSWTVARGVSQSGNFLRGLILRGFTQDTDRRTVYDGAWPIREGGLMTLNTRFALPDGTVKLYDAGREGPVWWAPWADPVRGLPAAGILDRCTASNSCPKVMEYSGSSEVWGLLLSPVWVGTDGRADLPLPANLRRYYIPSSRHGGGRGGFDLNMQPAEACPGPNYGRGTFPTNPMPHAETFNALRVHFRNWIMKDIPPPPSRWPTLRDKTLVEPTKEAMGFPTLPGVPPTAPTGLIVPMLDYDWGPDFRYVESSGVPSLVPPTVKGAIKGWVPRVDADGNELGGIPVVLRDAPLGTYLGWNITSTGVMAGQICGFSGGMIPFATTRAERMRNNDPRPSLEERYTNHDGYLAAVRAAAATAVSEGFLLQEDADRLIAQAAASHVLR